MSDKAQRLSYYDEELFEILTNNFILSPFIHVCHIAKTAAIQQNSKQLIGILQSYDFTENHAIEIARFLISEESYLALDYFQNAIEIHFPEKVFLDIQNNIRKALQGEIHYQNGTVLAACKNKQDLEKQTMRINSLQEYLIWNCLSKNHLQQGYEYIKENHLETKFLKEILRDAKSPFSQLYKHSEILKFIFKDDLNTIDIILKYLTTREAQFPIQRDKELGNNNDEFIKTIGFFKSF